MKRLLHTLRESEDGQAVVELALALPVLLIVVLGIVDFGRAVNYWNDENHLANIGARYAAVDSWPEECVEKEPGSKEKTISKPTLAQYLKCQASIDSTELTAGGGANGVQNGIKVCVSLPTSKLEVGQPVSVSVSAPYKWLPYPKVLGGTFSFATSTLTGTATMRLERVPPSESELTKGSSC